MEKNMRDKYQCPKCGRFSVEWDPLIEAYRCNWYDCLWFGINPPKAIKNSFEEFKKTLFKKKVIGE